MKVHLMYRDQDFYLGGSRQPASADLIQDLDLQTLFDAMADGDKYLLDVAQEAVLVSLHDPNAILYRQEVLVDCIENPEAVWELYAIAVEALEGERKIWGWMSRTYPEGALHRSRDVLGLFFGLLKKIRAFAETRSTEFSSDGFKQLFTMLALELDDEYLRVVEDHLRRLEFRDGALVSATLGEGNRGVNYVLRKPHYVQRTWAERLYESLARLTSDTRSELTYEVHERDEAGYRALSDLRSEGIRNIAASLIQSTDHILSFFGALRRELAFYLGCLNLRDRLTRKGEPVCLPEVEPTEPATFVACGLFDPCLSLNMAEKIVGNDVNAANSLLVMVTGANKGGKSTLLRAIGLAQLMTQCGMFVPAVSLRASLSHRLFTHFRREEDIEMKSGKFDEELDRMNKIIDDAVPNSMALFNESLASTTEREGAEIAQQIVRALKKVQVRVFYVTHMFTLAHGLYQDDKGEALFLRAERRDDGERTFRFQEGEPLATSYGEDLYRQIFETSTTG